MPDLYLETNMQIHIIISSQIRYDLVKQLVEQNNVTRYYINRTTCQPADNKGHYALHCFETCEDDTGALLHVSINEKDSVLCPGDSKYYGSNFRYSDKLEKILDFYKIESKVQYGKDNCHIVVSVTDTTHIPGCLIELATNIYIFQQRSMASLQSIHDNFLHHTFETVKDTKQYLFTNLTNKDTYITCSSYPHNLTVHHLGDK